MLSSLVGARRHSFYLRAQMHNNLKTFAMAGARKLPWHKSPWVFPPWAWQKANSGQWKEVRRFHKSRESECWATRVQQHCTRSPCSKHVFLVSFPGWWVLCVHHWPPPPIPISQTSSSEILNILQFCKEPALIPLRAIANIFNPLWTELQPRSLVCSAPRLALNKPGLTSVHSKAELGALILTILSQASEILGISHGNENFAFYFPAAFPLVCLLGSVLRLDRTHCPALG